MNTHSYNETGAIIGEINFQYFYERKIPEQSATGIFRTDYGNYSSILMNLNSLKNLKY